MNDNTMRYGLFVTIGVKPGQRDAVVDILLRDQDAMKDFGCDLYMVGTLTDQPDAVCVTEIWTSREAHRASLTLPSVQAAIAEAMPMLTGDFKQTEFFPLGGLGMPERASS